uniref:Peptidase S54 rhomboid domain-containing protein n=1 Tax=Erythrolobus australicus TaxID=1077150 RepID=A0A7S1TM79_9RHOD|mmetsp:Transcript_20/g.47  ORF Transcript_20/g.47 Transcript_20/m.47 type:complete len:464 (+) Transcript_20:400-1791(+)|eukprot:CAMPEP_0185832538 /NCGR_PEP_ID=MMETSP1353-20130828/2136_1 /TAXON_ID=1077150 /ORGANISM="Erythrolobus australicus, Strain CCMP3124" /LENGTH=463 /DNA_ID=CAMNT_0028530717 /DNA_START=386 /DNA_END=1777 /DNA_ORIENTATION=-
MRCFSAETDGQGCLSGLRAGAEERGGEHDPVNSDAEEPGSDLEAQHRQPEEGEEDPDPMPEMFVTSSSETLLIPVFLKDYTEQQKANLSSEDYELGHRGGKGGELVLTRGVIDKTRNVPFNTALRKRQLWSQLFGMLMFVLYELAIILAQILAGGTSESIRLQYMFYGAASSIVMLPVVTIAYVKCSWQYLNTHTLLSDWIVYAMQVFLPLPFGYRRGAYGATLHVPWFTALVIAVWSLMFVLTGPFGTGIGLTYMKVCDGHSITFANLMANFMHGSPMHLISNSLILLCFGVITEVPYGAVRAYLPVVLALPLVQPMMGFCGYVGGSALWGLLAGTSVAVWFSTLHWNANWDARNAAANFARGFGMLWLMNVIQVFGDMLRADGEGHLSHWVHASAQLTGFLFALVCMPLFERRVMHAPGEFSAKDAKPSSSSIWYHWYRIVAAVGLLCSMAYVIPAFFIEA